MATQNSSNIPTTNATVPAGNGTGFTSVSYGTASSASSLAQRDANSNLTTNSMIQGYATTATAAGTTTLTVSSAPLQYFTGSTTQTVVMPVTSTLVLGQSFTIVNNSSGVVTVQSSGGNTIQALAANSQVDLTVILTSGTTAASWSLQYDTQSGSGLPSTATSNQILQSVASSNPVWSTATYPGTTTANQILYSSANDTVTGLATANNRVLITSGAGVPSMATTLPTAVQGNITSLGSNGTMGTGWATTGSSSGANNTFTVRNTATAANSNVRIYLTAGSNSNNFASVYSQYQVLLSTGGYTYSQGVDTSADRFYLYSGSITAGTLIQTISNLGDMVLLGGLTLGNTTTPTTGSVSLLGGTSGTSFITVPSVAGSCTFTLPTTNGTAGQALLSDGGAATGYTFGDVALVSATSTWTPGIAFGGGTTGITYTTQSGQYTTLGNLVYFTCNIVLSNKGSSTGAVTITGLPVTTSAASSDNSVSINNFGDLTLSVGNTLVSGVFSASGSTISLQQTSLTGTLSNLTDTNFANTSQIRFSGFYFTT